MPGIEGMLTLLQAARANAAATRAAAGASRRACIAISRERWGLRRDGKSGGRDDRRCRTGRRTRGDRATYWSHTDGRKAPIRRRVRRGGRGGGLSRRGSTVGGDIDEGDRRRGAMAISGGSAAPAFGANGPLGRRARSRRAVDSHRAGARSRRRRDRGLLPGLQPAGAELQYGVFRDVLQATSFPAWARAHRGKAKRPMGTCQASDRTATVGYCAAIDALTSAIP